MALVLSDVHLGALHTKKSFFDLFLSSLLNRLERGDLPDLKALIILGDCFDLIMDTYQDLLQFGLYQNIYDKFEILYQMKDFHLIFALGNHEIPVVGNYNNTFTRDKNNMLQIFNNQKNNIGLNYSFFANDIFTQYVLLQPEVGTSKPLIKLFDREQDILNNNVRNTYSLNVEPQSTDLNYYLMAHGFQFDPDLSIFSNFWNLGLANPFSLIKQIGDGIWNGFFKKIYDKTKELVYYTQKKIKKMIKKETKRYIKDNNCQLDNAQNQQLKKELNIKWESENHREDIRDNQGCINNIVKIIPNFVNNGIPINHVIYGHTHDRLRSISKLFNRQVQPGQQQFQFQVVSQQSKFSISNTGAWQHVKKPSFIEIHTDWKVIPRVVPLEIGKVEQIIKR